MSEYPEQPTDPVESAKESTAEEKQPAVAGATDQEVEREMRRLSRRRRWT